MALARKITKAEFDKLVDALKLEYKADGEDYVLDATGFDDATAAEELRRAKEHEVKEHTKTRNDLKRLQDQMNLLTETDAKRKGDVDALTTSWEKKQENLKVEYEAKLAKKDESLKTLLIDNVATKLASDLSGENAEVILPHIRQRLTLDFNGETPITRVLDKDGKPSAQSITELGKEFETNPRFAPVIVASKASGGGANGGNRGNGGAGNGKKALKDMTLQERIAWQKNDPTTFDKAVLDQERGIVTA